MSENHKIVHIEIPVDEIQKAKDFYETIFKWKVTAETGFDNYAFFSDAEDGVGGAFQKSELKLEIAVLYISTNDIEQTLEKIANNGGKIINTKTKISDEYGYFALFEDPCGNQMGLWSRS